MKMGRNLVVSLGALGGLAALVASGLAFAACSSSSTPVTPPGGGDSGGMAPMCTATVGGFPAPNCDNSAQVCPATGACPTANCPMATAPGSCQPLANNAGKTTLDFRMSEINIAAPTILASPTIQSGIVTPAVELSPTQAPMCGPTGGAGTFNWLFSVNKTANTLTTGGAPTSADPFGMGYCFVNSTFGTTMVAPVTGPVTFTGNTFTSSTLANVLNVPIFYDKPTDPILLPIRGGVLQNVTISSDNDCVGSFNAAALDNKCSFDGTTCSLWKTNGSLGGYITLKDADAVNISALGESLCVLLTGTGAMKTASGQCPPDAFTKGDYCSSPAGPGGCNDSAWLAATFSASAVNINSGAGVPVCSGGTVPTDAGADTGGGTDSGGAADTGGATDAAGGG
jgi:hypothetical protein